MGDTHDTASLETAAHVAERRAMRECLLLLLVALLAVLAAAALPSADDGSDALEGVPQQALRDSRLGGNYFGAKFSGGGSDAEP